MSSKQNMAVLSYGQLQNFYNDGLVPQFHDDQGKNLPAYQFASSPTGMGGNKEWKLFPINITVDDLEYIYRRIDIAANAVDIIPEDTWGKFSLRALDKSGKEITDDALVTGIWQLTKKKRVMLMERMKDAHIMARLYGLGIVVLGLEGGGNLEEPVTKATGVSYARTYSKKEILDIQYYTDPNDEHYGEIKSYEIKVGGQTSAGNTAPLVVHADRVIHFNGKVINGDAWGVSILEAPYDLFQILKNTDWSAGESYYQNASPLYVLSWDDAEAFDAPTDEEIVEAKADLADIHVKKRYIKPKSWALETVTGSGVLPDPRQVWEPVVERIAGSVKVPKQLLLGTSAGALASGETNLSQYYKDINKSQENYAEPKLQDLVQRLQSWGILSEGTVDFEWAPLQSLSEKQNSEITKLNVESAVLAMGNPFQGVPPVMTVAEVRENILGLDPEYGGGEMSEIQQNKAVTSPVFQLDLLSDQMDAFTSPIIKQVRAGLLSKESALKMVDEYAERVGAQVGSLALTAVKRFAPPKEAVKIVGIPREAQRVLDRQVEQVKEFARDLINDATKPEPTPE